MGFETVLKNNEEDKYNRNNQYMKEKQNEKKKTPLYYPVGEMYLSLGFKKKA